MCGYRQPAAGNGHLIAGNLLGAVMIVLFGFLFVTVSSRLTGEIGSSSNPISGMTVATLLLTCLVFLLIGWTGPHYRLMALTIAAIVCIAASNGGTTSQDLKTGFLVGATPKYQQLGILVGSFTSSLVIGWILVVLNDASTVYTAHHLPELHKPLDVSQLPETVQGPDKGRYHVLRTVEGNADGVPPGKYLVDDRGQIRYLVDPGINGAVTRRDNGSEVQKFQAPKARLMSLITDGILTQKLPWTLVLLGVSIAVVLELCGVPSLPFAVGVYLPLSSSTPIFVGGMVRWIADRFARGADGKPRSEAESDMSSGVLLSTGYIAGGAIGGVLIAFLSFSDTIPAYLSQYQYATMSAPDAATLDAQYKAIAAERVGADRPSDVAAVQAEIAELNANQLPQYMPVPAGTNLKKPGNEVYVVHEATTLGKLAEQEKQPATVLADLNPQLRPPERLPPGNPVKVPQREWPAMAAFGLLTALLAAVGLGWWMAPKAA
jgi:LysM repeat protein